MSDLTLHRDRHGLGQVPPKSRTRFAVPVLAPMPRSDWREFDLTVEHPAAPPLLVENQGRLGACNAYAAAKSDEWDRWLSGLTHIRLNQLFIYSILTGGRDVGSNIGDALTLLKETGTPRFDLGPQSLVSPTAIAGPARQDAANHRIEIGEMLPDFDSLMTAVQLRRPGNFSLRVGANFDSSLSDSLGSDGVVGYSRGPGNHAICYVPAAKKLASGEWAIKFQNSWGPAWGQKGFAWFTRKHIDGQAYFEAYSVVAACDTPGDPTNPPAVVRAP